MFHHQIYPEDDADGQSLVEYAMVLLLVALVLIAVVTVFGSGLRNTYCKIIHQVAPDADLSNACRALIVTPELIDQGPNHINIEVQVFDPDGDPTDPYAAITRVEFRMDDPSSSPVHTEFFYRYCLGGNSGLNPCNNYNTSGLASGQHTIYITAYDTDGNTGTARYVFTK